MPATIELSVKQAESIARAEGRVNIWEGSVRSGKTIASLFRWLQHVRNAPASGQLVMVGKTLQTLHRNVILPLQDPTQFGPVASTVKYTAGAPQGVILGKAIHMIGANDLKSEEKVRGMTGSGGYVDEITIIPEMFFNQLLSRMSVPGAKVFGSTNPDNPSHWVRRNFLLSGNAWIRSFKFKIDDNPFLDPEFVVAQKEQYHGLYYRRFIEGEWVMAEGAIYDMWDRDLDVVDILPPMRQWICLSIDYGTANPFHALLLGLGVDGLLYVAGEWRYDGRAHMRQLTDAEYADRVSDWLVKRPVRGHDQVIPSYWVVDPSALSFRTELRDRGIIQVEAINSVLDGIRLVSSLMGKHLLKVHRSCEYLLGEIDGYSWDDRLAMLGEDRPVKLNDHGVDALRYAVSTTQRLWRPYMAMAQGQAA
jgi:PBSX family phage terminase large subunit